MIGHGFSRQITEKCGTKYGNGNYILGQPKWKWELILGRMEYILLYYTSHSSPINDLTLLMSFNLFDYYSKVKIEQTNQTNNRLLFT